MPKAIIVLLLTPDNLLTMVQPKDSFNTQSLIYGVFWALVKDQIEASDQFCGDGAKVSGRCNRQKDFFSSTVQAHLKRICKLINLHHCSRNADFP